MTTKPKINKTNRIRLKTATVYVSYMIVQKVRHLCLKAENNVMIPLKGKSLELEATLNQLRKQHPDDFTSSGHSFLGRWGY